MTTRIEHAPQFFDRPWEAMDDLRKEGFWPELVSSPSSGCARGAGHATAHFHATDEFLYLLEGAMTFTELAATPSQSSTVLRTYHVKARDRLFIPAGTVHEVHWDGEFRYLMGIRDPSPPGALFQMPVQPTTRLNPNLAQLNTDFSGAEFNRDVGFFFHALAENLVFQRHSGQVVDKWTFLRDLVDPGNTFTKNAAKVTRSAVWGKVSLVEVEVDAAGRRELIDDFAGQFQNVRLFVEEGGMWRCQMWFNRRI
jgi:Cupin domain